MKNKALYSIGIDKSDGINTAVFVRYEDGVFTVMDVVEAKVICADYDSECEDVKDKTKCWLYDCAKGLCPYLQ